MNRVTFTLATWAALGIAVSQPAARGDTPISGPLVFTSGPAGAVWGGNLYAVNHRHHHGYYHPGYDGGYGRIFVPSPFWTPPTVVVPYVAPPTAAYPSIYGAPGCYYGSSRFQYYGPRFSLGLSF